MSPHVTGVKPRVSLSNPVATPNHKLDTEQTVAPDLSPDHRVFANLQNAPSRTILYLQRTAGNHALADALHRNARQLGVQPKLTVGPVDDRFEREADETAGRVMRMVAPIRRRDDVQPDQIQRAETDQADTRDGFSAGGDFQRQLRTGQGGGQALPAQTRRFMESRFDAGFDRVRVHTDAGAQRLNDGIQAKAFTHGSHIFFNRNQFAPDTNAGKHLLAHELTHVVQQGAAVQRTPTIQRATAPVVQRGVMDWLKKKFGKKKTETKPTTKTSETTAPTTKDVSEAKNHPADESLQDAITYERNLGRYAFNHGKANSAAKTMVDKMTGVMVGEVDEKNEDQKKQLVELYGRDKADSAGQVGANIKNVLGVLKEGNLRERLTALMNAMFGPFKQYVPQAMKDSAWGEMGLDKGLNVEKLKRRKRQMRFNLGAKDLFRDPGNPLDRKKYGSYEYTGKTRFARKETSERTVGDLEKGPFSIGLSEREKELQFPNQAPEDIQNEKLKWMEGGTYWGVNRANKWVKKIENSLHMPVIAGPSGSMLRMFQTWEYLNKPVPAADWRLAVLGWMLSSNDHSFHEMMLTASDFGLPYTPGHLAYMDIAPLAVNELRQNVAVGGLFPHEIALKRKVEGGQIKHLMTPDSLQEGKNKVRFMDKSERGALSGPGAAAVNLYTTFGYLILNPTRKGGMFAKQQVERNLSKKDELDEFKDDFESGKLTAKELMQEAKEIMPVLDSALETLPDWKGKLFRGTGMFNPYSYRKNSTIKFGAYTSATLDEDTAQGFADDYNIGPYKYILHLNTFAGKDVRQISDYSEDEILIPPGSVYTVEKRVPPKTGRKYYHVHLKQTQRGGKGLKLDPEKDSMPTPKPTDVDESDSTNTALPTVIKEYVTSSAANVDDENGKHVGEIGVNENVGVTGVKKGDLCQMVWGKQLVYLTSEWFEIDFGEKYPLKGTVETTTTTAPVTPVKPSLTYFNAKGDTSPVGVLSLDQADLINDENDKGEGWMEFNLLSDGMYYWCKTEDFDKFRNPPKPPLPTTSAPTLPSTTLSEPKQQTLQLYDSNDNHIDTMDDPDEILDETGSSYTDDHGTEWIEIASKGGMMYWVKKAEYEAFTS